MKNILVAVDLEETSQKLVAIAAEQAEKFDCKVWVLHIADPDPDFVGNKVGPQYIRDLQAVEVRHEHKLVRQYADSLIEKGIAAEGLLVQGATVDMILEEIHKLDISLVIIGRHEHSLLYKLFTGTTYSAVVKKSKVPVLIVPL